mmetsp:Transcript_115177/g.161898  ORF Transcript_115177/g.161898 Transcript_115177/m.161898 type:complete len:299 (-) Transcript_115177:1158-2054(-)
MDTAVHQVAIVRRSRRLTVRPVVCHSIPAARFKPRLPALWERAFALALGLPSSLPARSGGPEALRFRPLVTLAFLALAFWIFAFSFSSASQAAASRSSSATSKACRSSSQRSAGFFFCSSLSSLAFSSCSCISLATFSAVRVEIGMPTRYSKSLTAVLVTSAASSSWPLLSSSSSASASFSSDCSPWRSRSALKPCFRRSWAKSAIFRFRITILPSITNFTKRALALNTSHSRVSRARKYALRVSYIFNRTCAKSCRMSFGVSYFLILPSESKSIMLFMLMEERSLKTFSKLSLSAWS